MYHKRLFAVFAVFLILNGIVAVERSPASVPLSGHRPSQSGITIEQICPKEITDVENIWLQTDQAQICPVGVQISSSKQPNTTSENQNHHPWDFTPRCVSSKKVYCVYTSSSFAHGRGISILTTPSTASTISSQILASEDLETSSESSTVRFYEKELPGRGKGYISNGTFHKGDLLLTSTPVLIVHEAAIDAIPTKERQALQNEAIANLPPRTQDLFYALAGHFGGDKTEDILTTNGFWAGLGSRKEGHGIIVPEAARLNHDCRPNARFAFDPQALVHKVHATRTILPGEELTFSYIDSKQLFAARQRQIKAHWGFECGCPLCSAPESLRAESDARLERVPALRGALMTFSGPSLRTTTVEMALELVQIYEEEGLDGALAEAYMLAAFRFCIWEMEDETMRWAKSAVEHWLVWEKGGETNLGRVKMLSHLPKEGWCWAMRRNILQESSEI